jgi:hypothetical protein
MPTRRWPATVIGDRLFYKDITRGAHAAKGTKLELNDVVLTVDELAALRQSIEDKGLLEAKSVKTTDTASPHLLRPRRPEGARRRYPQPGQRHRHPALPAPTRPGRHRRLPQPVPSPRARTLAEILGLRPRSAAGRHPVI